jgi:hypothetical protein
LVDLTKYPDLAHVFAADEAAKPNSFTITYGERTRSAWGYITGRHDVGFWFIKQQQCNPMAQPRGIDADLDVGADVTAHVDVVGFDANVDGAMRSRAALVASWPEPIRSFAAKTCANEPEADNLQAAWWEHGIEDQAPLARWSRENVTLIGDACHATTPNMGRFPHLDLSVFAFSAFRLV